MQAGHWCPQCAAPPWKSDEVANVDPLFASHYYLNHGKDEHQKVDYLYCPNEAQPGTGNKRNAWGGGPQG